jgi:hypothetical protein
MWAIFLKSSISVAFLHWAQWHVEAKRHGEMSETWLSFHQTILLDQGCDIHDTASLRLEQDAVKSLVRTEQSVKIRRLARERSLCYYHGLISNAKHCAGGWLGMQSGNEALVAAPKIRLD